ncbi:MAG: 2-dehydropantoate 2-reductase [Burkholderiales bacterium]|nr:2-dehydropantoate 2-reductase [Burkholderiales bacterium]
MNICIFGAGAVGSHVAARLAAAGTDTISIIGRGPHLQAVKARGITLRPNDDPEIHGRPAAATDDPSTLPPQDIVLVSLKATALPGAADAIAKLLAPDGVAIFLNNGLTWWWPHGLPGNRGPLRLLDPEGRLWNQLAARTLGCVVQSPNEIVEPGIVVHKGRCRFIIGEPDNSQSARLQATIETLMRGGVPAVATADIRREIWSKLLLNASGNTLSALTRLSPVEMGPDPGLQPLMRSLMAETLEVAAALGWDLRGEVNVDELSQRKDRKPGLRLSMLQDVVRKRPMEIEALIGQTQAFGRETGVPTPTIDVILPLLRGLQRGLQLE